MKEIYLDIMEKSLSAYTNDRINDYINEVKAEGLKEHGFPRLASNIGILIAYNRRVELLPLFIEMMDICCEQMPCCKAANEFTIREVCCCLMLLEEKETVDPEILEKWKEKLKNFDPWNFYNVVAPTPQTPVGNFATFSAVSEFVRGEYCDIDTSEFVDWQISSQLLSFDENGMYKDPGNPIVYDIVVRLLFSSLLLFGYKGRFAKKIEEQLEKSAELTLKMQSVTGEMAFGGRSNQFLITEPMLSAYCEMEALRYSRKGNAEMEGKLKAAALLAANYTLNKLNEPTLSHIKNKYGVDSGIGCERYGYFNKYMITTASNIYIAYLFADDNIKPTYAPAEKGGYIAKTGKEFHKLFFNAAGYSLEFETDADFSNDANGLGRVHKKGCHSSICLSVPFPKKPNYKTEGENEGAMSICCFAEKDSEILYGAEEYVKYELLDKSVTEREIKADILCRLSEDVSVKENYTVNKDGVRITFGGYEKIGFMLPIFDFDGEKNSRITINENNITVEYEGNICRYEFEGRLDLNYKSYYNRNGRYRVFRIFGKRLHIYVS